MRWFVAALLLVACANRNEPIRPRPYYLDDPLFDVWASDPQVGTVLITDRLNTLGTEEVIHARFDPAGDRGMYTLVDEEGDCRLYSFRGFCDPECDYIETMCVDGACVPFPAFVPIGSLTVEGLGDRRELRQESFWFGPEESTAYVGEQDGVDDGLLAEALPIAVTAEGGDLVPGFAAAVAGVDPIDWDLRPGRVLRLSDVVPLELSWQSPVQDARVRLVLRTGESGHGAPPREKLVCDLADRGQLVVPTALIALLPEMDLPDHGGLACVGACNQMPSGLMRYRASRVDTAAGRVEVVAASETLFWAVH